MSRVQDFSTSQALNKVAFLARNKVIANIDRVFDIRSEWVRKGVLVKPSSVKDDPIQAIVFHRYWGIAQQEKGATRQQTRDQPWLIPTALGRKWLKSAGFKRKPQLKRILKTEVTGRKPFFKHSGPRPSTGRRKGKRFQLKPEMVNKGGTTLVWTRTSTSRLPIKLLFIAYDRPLRIDSKPWFEDTVKDTYDRNFVTFQVEALKVNMKKMLLGKV